MRTTVSSNDGVCWTQGSANNMKHVFILYIACICFVLNQRFENHCVGKLRHAVTGHGAQQTAYKYIALFLMIYYNYIILLIVLREQSACRYCISRNDFRALNENQRFENAALL